VKHPDESDLALYAGEELGLVRRCRVARHLSVCARCREEVAEFEQTRRGLADAAAEMPSEVNWNRLAAEMRANIHVGLAAGECVEPSGIAPAWLGWRAAAAVIPVALVLVAGWWLLPSRPGAVRTAEPEGIVLEATADGIALREHGSVFALQHPAGGDVTYTVNAQGSLRSRYVDSETMQVTINNVYAQ